MNVGAKRLCALLMSVCMLVSASLSTVALAATLEEEVKVDFGNIAWEKRTVGGQERDVCVVEITAASKTNPTFNARDFELYIGFNKTVLNYYKHEEGQIAPYEVRDEFGDVVKTTTMDASTNRTKSNDNSCVFALIIDKSTDHNGNHVIQSGQVILKLLFMPQEGMDNQSSQISFKIPEGATDYASKKSFVALANQDVYTLDDTAEATIPPAKGEDVKTYTVTVTDGKAEPAEAVTPGVEAGKDVKITADTKEGQTFKAWEGLDGVTFAENNSATSNPVNFKMPAKNLTVKATYNEPVQLYTVTVTDGKAEPAEAVTPGVEAGKDVKITADAKEGQTFKAWEGLDGVTFAENNSATSNPVNFKMPAQNLTVTATYNELYTVKATKGTPEPAKAVTPGVEVGTPITITADAAPTGQEFSAWTGLDGVEFTDGTSASSNPVKFKMPAQNLTPEATYKPIQTYTVKVEGGTAKVEGKDPAETLEGVTPGTEVTITIGWGNLVEWTGAENLTFVNGNKNTSPATFKMPSQDVTLKAETQVVDPVLTVNGGNSSHSGPTKAGTEVTITAMNQNENGESFQKWEITGEGAANVQFTDGSATTPNAKFKMPDKEVTFTAVYEVQEVTITFEPGEGSGTMEAQKAPKGKPFTMPESGFKAPDDKTFNGWGWKISGSDVFVSAGNQFTFNEDTTVTAQYIGGCYVATAVYGSYDCPEVWTLRRFRDDVLAQTWYGRLFIRCYYAVSPTAVRLFGGMEWFQNFWRAQLDKMVENLQSNGFESTPYEDKSW